MGIPIHPLAETFPLIEGAPFNELVASIKENGLREPITIFEDAILDGRNRYRACEAADVAPRIEQFNGDDPVRFVIDKNINRRHLNESQRGLIAGKLTALKAGRKSIADISAITRKQAADLLCVSEDTVTNAKKVLAEGTPEDIKAIEAGKASVTTVADNIRAHAPKGKRGKSALRSEAKAAEEKRQNSHKQRVATLNMQADIWRRLREALDHLTSLPLPTEVAAIARVNDKKTKGAAVERKLASAIEWLNEFQTAWENRK